MRRWLVRVLSRSAIREAGKRHGEWRASLEAWYKVAKSADWKSFEDVRQTWSNVDKVGQYVIFDIAHNRCRLVTAIKYRWAMVYIRAIHSHAEYDRKDWEEQ
jgi:mRNA interferase HigB